MNKTKMKIITGILLLGLFCGVAMAAPLIESSNPTTDPTTNVGETQEFSISTNETCNITWYIDSTVVDSATNVDTDTYSNNTAPAGSYTVKAEAENANGTVQKEWTWTVESESLSIESSDPATDPTSSVGETQEFTIDTNQLCNITWYIDDVVVKDSATNVDTDTYSNNTAPAGSYTVKAEAKNANGTVPKEWTWTVDTVESESLSIESFDPATDPKSTVGQTQEFTIDTNQLCNITWYIDDVVVKDSATNVDTDTYSNNTAPAGSYTVKAEAENANGTVPKEWTWTVDTVESEPEDPEITEKYPDKEEVEITEGEKQAFNVTTDQECTIRWLVNGDEKKETDSPVTEDSYTFEEKKVGTYNITAEASNGNGTVSSKWTLYVRSKYYSSGNRIWEAKKGLSTTYEWNPQSYSGFYYDLESGVGSETMTITLDGTSNDPGRTIDDGNLVYRTEPVATDFEHNDWGKYYVIGFMAEKYFAGYIDDEDDGTTVEGETLDANLIGDGVLAKVLIDSDDKESAYTGSSFDLEDGYALNIVEVDVNGNSVWVQLEKDGDVVDDDFLKSNNDYVYETDLGDSDNVPIIIVHFGTVFAGQETSAVFIEGIFQISDNYIEIEDGEDFGKMTVSGLGDDYIEMENDGSISLSKGKTIDIMGKLQIVVADDDVLRFAPIVDMSDPGTYELRGTVFDAKKDTAAPEWTPLNFEGFYYDIDEGLGTESLTITNDEFDPDDRSIDDGDLEYRTNTTMVEFEHSGWGKFEVIGFMAKKYFAGYPEDAVDGEISDDISILDDGYLSEVLTDSDEKESMYSGSALILEDGYSLNIEEVDINGNSVWVKLEQDGKVVDEDILSSGDDYIYKADIGDAEDVPVIIVHFGTIFAGAETSAVFTEGIFQISEDYTQIEDGESFGEMEVDSFGDGEIVMRNDGSISLSKDKTINLMGDVKIKVADSSTLRFYPLVEFETKGGASRELKISIPDEIIVGDDIEIEVTAGGDGVEDAAVKLDGKSIGKTDEDGIVEYTASSEGTFKVTAEKDGYTTANKNIEVIPPKERMSLSVSPETAYVGDKITIKAEKAIGGDAIKDAEISIDGTSLGKTGSDGTVTYTTKEAGTIKVSAVKEGFVEESMNVRVKEFEALFEFSNLVIDPIEVRAGKEAKISIDVENTGNAAGEYNVELVVNGSVVDSQSISLDAGQSTTVTFTHVEEVPGTYKVEIDDQEAEYTVLEKSSVLLYALGALILAIAGGAAYMFTKGGWTVATLQEKVQELLDSVKPKK
ncbi:hypothetical protein FTO70_09950 [Methanosarcina sp. KYL-1]|uniref:S-layer protein domain-containing protein n=1 Tax=Methanosarcina sp. KYL-1 TaxID=2602068 RepID=UPI002101A447|nr:S-layer protein domain-containing protein [Methanosarcina sp. KYL-1]MCQ1535995.1 hypothetical protein [Methanosarcina sp. KYL-1]